MAGSLGRGAVPLLFALGACEPTGGFRDGSFGTGDTGAPPRPPDATNQATQVGSEGFWDCPIDRRDPVVDPAAPLASMSGSAIEVTAVHVGPWPLQIVDAETRAAVGGQLDLADTGGYTWVTVAPGIAGCADYLESEVSGALVRDVFSSVVTGVVAIRPDDARLLATDAGDLSATAAAWGAPAMAGAVGFRVEADVTAQLLDGEAAYVSCDAGVVDCGGRELVGEILGSR